MSARQSFDGPARTPTKSPFAIMGGGSGAEYADDDPKPIAIAFVKVPERKVGASSNLERTRTNSVANMMSAKIARTQEVVASKLFGGDFNYVGVWNKW